MYQRLFLIVCLMALTGWSQAAEIQESSIPAASHAAKDKKTDQLDPSLVKDALHAMRISEQWLEKQQQDDGCWSNPAFPALSGLVISAIMSTPDVHLDSSKPRPEAVERGLDFILTKVQPDGSICQQIEGIKGGGLPTYNTAICIMALADSGDPSYGSVISKGRQWLMDSQYMGEGVYHGGMGYDANHDRAYADLSNTVLALEALRRTEPVEKDSQAELNWGAAIDFISHCQHLQSTNDADWVSNAPDQVGGFVYTPEKSQAGSVESADDGKSYLRSYGSMSYAGLLSFIYANVAPDDVRVKAAVDWVQAHWSLDENPYMGQEGLYYYYQTMAKALNVAGIETVELTDGRQIAWREALIKKILSLQRIDPQTGLGYWQNENNRWWENDPVLVTAYTLRALSLATFGDMHTKL